MKQSIALSLVLVLSVAVPAGSHAQSGGTKNMDTGKKPAAAPQASHTATGVVKKVDATKGTVTLAHDPVFWQVARNMFVYTIVTTILMVIYLRKKKWF